MAQPITPAKQDPNGIEALRAELAKLAAENAALKATAAAGIRYKVSDKGALSAYGLGRWPVTLYAGQWEALDADAANRKAFITANATKLQRKV